MLISAHFPLNNLKRGLKYVDFPFILAHLWYRKGYRETLQHFANTFAIVDNGTHENGKPKSTSEIAGILAMGGAWKGILPDFLHKPVKSWTATIKSVQMHGLDLRHWGMVLHGSEPEHIRFQHDLAVALGVGVVCFPFKAPREMYLDSSVIKFVPGQRYHLMGLSEKDNLEGYVRLPGKWSIDSTKIWRIDLERQPNWHGYPYDSEHGFVDWELLKNNLAYLKERFNAGITGRISSGSPQ